tara:strand:- start:1554 stop:1772 length:219 start_codon:yes stop_codon:yes gene_type:complete
MITAKIKESKEEVNDFPKLMKSNDSYLIVLFTSKYVGTVLVKGNTWNVGHVSDDWSIMGFTDFEGELTLKNK